MGWILSCPLRQSLINHRDYAVKNFSLELRKILRQQLRGKLTDLSLWVKIAGAG